MEIFTPFGSIPSEFDLLGSREKQREFLYKEKHQLLDGLVIEDQATQIARDLCEDDEFDIIDVATMIAGRDKTPRNRPHDSDYASFVWIRQNSNDSNLQRYLNILKQVSGQATFKCFFRDNTFILDHPEKGELNMQTS
jgi:hypothetical protein